MKHRVFVGLPVSEILGEEIRLWESNFQQLPVRWLDPKNLHLTLIPPWYEERVEAIVAGLEQVKSEPFAISLTRVRYGPNLRRPRLIWAQGPVTGGLLRLKDSLEAALKKEAAIKNYFIHLTLARFSERRFGEFKIKSLDEKVSWRERVKSFVLYESSLRKEGASYGKVWEGRLG